MLRIHHSCAVVLIVGGLFVAPGVTRAAESYDNCTGFIDSVPTTISTQGVWCLRHDLNTNITNGVAITIATNNVTIDCNDFKLGGLAAGNGSNAYGIEASGRHNATIRHCNVRGFYIGIFLDGAGHLIEDNRLDNNLFLAINVNGDNNRVRRNAVYDTGGKTGSVYGIYAAADLVDNSVSGLFAGTSGGGLYGITVLGDGAQVRGNRVSGFDMTAAQGGAVSVAYGILLSSDYQRVSGNQVNGSGPVSGTGIFAPFPAYCLDNSVGGFTTNIHGNCTGSGNETLP